jgi:hypothetical protein
MNIYDVRVDFDHPHIFAGYVISPMNIHRLYSFILVGDVTSPTNVWWQR